MAEYIISHTKRFILKTLDKIVLEILRYKIGGILKFVIVNKTISYIPRRGSEQKHLEPKLSSLILLELCG